MDSTRFDTLTRDVAAATSRRGLLGSTFAGTLAGLGLAPLLGAEETEAAKSCKKKCQKKDNKDARKKCKKKCKPTDTITNPNANTKALRQACTSTEECIGDLLCQGANSQQSCPGQEVGTFCCVPTDVQASCDNGCDCCGLDVICNGGYCDSA